jgi:hypothetical protein
MIFGRPLVRTHLVCHLLALAFSISSMVVPVFMGWSGRIKLAWLSSAFWEVVEVVRASANLLAVQA